MTKEELRAHQTKTIKERQAELEKLQQEQEDYLQSEQYQRDCWEHYQDHWEQKAKKEGWTYERKPFVSAADRQRMAEQAKQQEIAFLQEKIKALQEG